MRSLGTDTLLLSQRLGSRGLKPPDKIELSHQQGAQTGEALRFAAESFAKEVIPSRPVDIWE